MKKIIFFILIISFSWGDCWFYGSPLSSSQKVSILPSNKLFNTDAVNVYIYCNSKITQPNKCTLGLSHWGNMELNCPSGTYKVQWSFLSDVIVNLPIKEKTIFNGDGWSEKVIYYNNIPTTLSGKIFICSDTAPPYKSSDGTFTCDRKCEQVGYKTVENNDTKYCVPINKCPSQNQLYQEALKKCDNNASFIKSYTCNSSTGDINIQCVSCATLVTLAQKYCKNLGGTLSNFTCENNTSTSKDINISFLNVSSFTPSICNLANMELNTSDNNSTNNDYNNSNSTNNDYNNSNSTNNDYNNSNYSNTDNPNYNDVNWTADDNNDFNESEVNSNSANLNSCPNPCDIRNNWAETEEINNNCHVITNPIFENNNKKCIEEYMLINGKCVPGCTGDNNDTKKNNDNNLTSDKQTLNNLPNFIGNSLKKISISENVPYTIPKCQLYTQIIMFGHKVEFPNILCQLVNLVQQYNYIFSPLKEILIIIASILGYLTIFK